jgi:RNA polymerase sigma-70 factor (ECF subfamily)
MSLLKLFKQEKNAKDRFIILLRPYVENLYRLAYRFCGSREDAEDLVQDLLLKLYPRMDELEKVDNLQSWLATVLYRQFIDRTRHASRSPITQFDTDEAFDPPDPSNSRPDVLTSQAREIDKIQTALLKLNDDQRALVVLHDIEGYRLTELHKMLDVPLGTLKSRLHRARDQLKRSLDSAD